MARPKTAPTEEGLSLADLRATFDDAPFGVLAIGADGIVHYVNRRQCENSQLPAEGFLGKDYRENFRPVLERSGLHHLYDELEATGEPFSSTLLDYRRLVDDEHMAFTLRGWRAGPWTILATSIERLLAERQAHYLQLFENANDGIFLLSRDARFVQANRKFCEIVGVARERVIGQTTEIFLPGRLRQSLDRLERILREGHLGPYELEINTPLGTKYVSLNGFALIEPGKPVGVINIMRDVTEEHRQAEELRAARDQALESVRLKSAFLANMSHEIRTPLNVILGYGSLLADFVNDPGAGEMLASMQRAGKRLQETIDSLLDISKLEAGAFSVHPEPVDLVAVVKQHIRDFSLLAQDKGLELSFQSQESTAVVAFDLHCLHHALANLLSNAIKFTPRGGVSLDLSRETDGGLVLRVRDSGVGMDVAFLDRLGEPFVQEDSGFNRRFEGTGLGLALTRRYVERNGARLSVESEKGKGSVFTIHFAADSQPLVEPAGAEPTPPPPLAAKLSSKRVLVVEDDAATSSYMKSLLGRHCEVVLAADGRETLAALSSQPVDLVLMDLSLRGGEDGLTLTRRVREDARWRELPIIALTAHALAEDRERALGAGCNDYVAKPLDPRELIGKMVALLPISAPDEPPR